MVARSENADPKTTLDQNYVGFLKENERIDIWDCSVPKIVECRTKQLLMCCFAAVCQAGEASYSSTEILTLAGHILMDRQVT